MEQKNRQQSRSCVDATAAHLQVKQSRPFARHHRGTLPPAKSLPLPTDFQRSALEIRGFQRHALRCDASSMSPGVQATMTPGKVGKVPRKGVDLSNVENKKSERQRLDSNEATGASNNDIPKKNSAHEAKHSVLCRMGNHCLTAVRIWNQNLK